MAIDGGPVIASSNRWLAILPYMAILHEEDHHRWGAIMPWEFPQKASKEVEEAFLLKEFDEGECRKQGFAFLKQVWLSIAINNFENRMPFIVNGWFEQKGQEYLDDPSFEVHLLNEDARAHTFFEQAEIKLYGSVFLDTAVKCIQNEIRRKSANPPAVVPAAASSSSEESTSVDDSKTDKDASPVTTNLPPLQPAKNTKPTPTTTTVLKPTANVFSSSNTPVQATAEIFQPSFNPRSFSDEVDTSHQRGQHNRKRGSNGKRSSFTDRAGYRPAQGFNDARQSFGKMAQGYPPPQAQSLPAAMAQMPQFATRGPNSFSLPPPSPQCPLPFSPRSAPPPPLGYPSAPPPPGFEKQQPRHFPVNSHPAFGHGPPPPQTFGNPLLSERNTNHGDARYYLGQPDRSMYDQESEHGRKRRDSAASHGGRPGNHNGNGRGRGRGGRNRNSIDEEYHTGHHNLSGGHSDRTGFTGTQEDRQFHAGQRTFDDRGSWRQKQNENIAPGSHHFDPFPHGPPQILHNPRRASQTQQIPAAGMQQPSHMALPFPKVEHRLAPGNTSSGKASGFDIDPCVKPLEEYGCSRTSIGDKCTYANKVIAFAVPADIPDHAIRQCFEQFGPVKHIAEVRNALTDGGEGDPHRFIAFHTADPARACVKQRNVVIYGKQITVEVAKEFWDTKHFMFEARTAKGMLFKDSQNIAPPWMHYIHNSALGAAVPPPVASTTRPYEQLPRDLEAVVPVVGLDSMISDTAPTTSGPATPEGKLKRCGKKNKKAIRKEPVNRTPKGIAQQTRPCLTPIPDDASSVTTVDTKHTTPVKRNKSLQTKPAEHVAASSEAASNDSSVVMEPQVSVSKSLPSIESSNTASLAKDQPKTCTDAIVKEDDAEIKCEEEPVDDSFHSASATPTEECDMTDEFATTPRATLGKPVVQSAAVDTAIPGVSEPSASTDTKSEVVEDPVQKDNKKVLLPALPKSKSKVSIALPEIDTSQTPSTAPEEISAASDIDPQRTVSGSSDVATGFVTAPNTPGSPVIGQKGIPEIQSKKEIRAQEDNKAKGPAQTESFSLFGKVKKGKKSKSSKNNSRQTSRQDSPILPVPEDLPTRKGKNTAVTKAITQQPEPAENPVEPFVPKQQEVSAVQPIEVNDTTDTTQPGVLDQTQSAEEVLNIAAKDTVLAAGKSAPSTAPSPSRGSILRRLTGMFSGSSDPRPVVVGSAEVSSPETKTKPATEESSSTTDKAEDLAKFHETGPPDTAEATAAAEASSSNKNKKKKKSKKKPATGESSSDIPIVNTNQPKAVVLEMSHLAPSNEISTPLYEFHGTDTKGSASDSSAAVSKQDSDQSPPVKAPPIRRVHPRFKRKKSSDSSDSRAENIPDTGLVRQPNVSTRDETSTAEQNNVCNIITLTEGHLLQVLNIVESNNEQGQSPKMYVVFVKPDPVEESRRRIDKLDKREKEIKQQKQEMGRIVGEVHGDGDDEVEKAAESTK
ncbi:putative RNA recognition motif domain, nucleotide-binding alpha-beta plait domain superfamily [Septoria linicola]|nr:putative RNA recognition motif domain, nucleotide-binding alpha-beta plait domain superfamily [Septoria linicola]